MLNTILNTYLEIIRQRIIGTIVSDDTEIDVKFVKPYAKGNELYMNAINVALFSSIPEKELLGTYTFGTPTADNNAIYQKPPLRMALDTLLVFNFNRYETALDCYGQVLGYFYNNDVFNVTADGFEDELEVQVLISSFTDRNEIEIWNSFNTPGIMMLRYELKYAVITGKFDELPVIQSYEATASQPSAADVSTLIMNMIYLPVAEILSQNILTATNDFCSINLDGDQVDDEIVSRYNALLESYTKSEEEIVVFTVYTQLKIDNGDLDQSTFEPFIPSLEGMIELIPLDRENLEALEPTVDNYETICDLARKQIDEPTGLISIFLNKLSETTAYLAITEGIDANIQTFNVYGDSAYIIEGTYPDFDFMERADLNVSQIRQKWWEIQDAIKTLMTSYSDAYNNALFDREGEAYDNFKELLLKCLEQLEVPYDAFVVLNKKYNTGDVTSISEEARSAYLEAYSKAYVDVNYVDDEEASEALAAALQDIFIEQNLIT